MDSVFKTAYETLRMKLSANDRTGEGRRLFGTHGNILKSIIFKTIKPQVNHDEGLEKLPTHIENINALSPGKGKLKIVFCVPRLYIQHVNHSRGLRQRGHKTVLVCSWPLTTYGPPLRDILKEFDYVYCTGYDNFVLFDAISQIRGDLLYTVDYMNNNWFCQILQMLWKGKTVLEVYDLADNVGYPKEFTEKVVEKSTGKGLARIEKAARMYLYSHVDGLVFKDGEKAFERLKRNYPVSCPALKFHPYFSRSTWEGRERPKLSAHDGRLHVVHSGFIPPRQLFAGTHLHHCIYDAAQIVADQGIHFHIYNPLDLDGTLLTDFAALADKSPFIHYHRPVYINDLPSTLSQYDIGWMVYDYSDRPAGGTERYEVSFSSRMLTYIAAGLPFFVAKEFRSMAAFAQEKGVGHLLDYRDIDCLGKIVKRFDMDAGRMNVNRVREELAMDQRVKHLEAFFMGL